MASIEALDASYSNVDFMGIPLCLLAFGADSLPAAVIATLFTASVLFLAAITVIEIDLHHGVSSWLTARKVRHALIRNPPMLAPFGGLAVSLSGRGLLDSVERIVSLLDGGASPCSLVCIGLFLTQESVAESDAPSIGMLVGLKLLVQPAVTALLMFYVFHVPPTWSGSAVLLSALPIGSGPFTIVKLYGLRPALPPVRS